MLIGVALFLVLLVGLLAIPITLEFDVAWRKSLQRNLRLHWVFGIVRVRVPSSGPPAEPHPERAQTQKKRRSKRSARGFGNVLAAVRNRRFRSRLMRFARDLWTAAHKQSLLLRLRIGLGDPADTGRLWAVVGPISGVLSAVPNATIEIEPEFFDPVFELNTSGRIRIVPLHVAYLLVGLVFSPSVWGGVKSMRSRAP